MVARTFTVVVAPSDGSDTWRTTGTVRFGLTSSLVYGDLGCAISGEGHRRVGGSS